MTTVQQTKFNELLTKLTSFQSFRYCKADIEAELRKLQQEMLNLVFDKEHAQKARLTIWDAYNQLEKENMDKGHVADVELKVLKEECRRFSNLIKSEISGNRGERIVFEKLSMLNCKHRILHNVELSDGKRKTEIDFIVFTQKAIIIVEVKNTKKNAYIDEQGDYYRIGEYQSLDCNLKLKMDNREQMLCDVIGKTLEKKDKPVNIIKLVVFTNKHIELRNKCSDLNVCFLTFLSDEIEGYEGEYIYIEEDMNELKEAVREAVQTNEYKLEMDMQQFKEHFVKALVKLESVEEKAECEEEGMEKEKNTMMYSEVVESVRRSEEEPVKTIFKIGVDKYKEIFGQIGKGVSIAGLVFVGVMATKHVFEDKSW